MENEKGKGNGNGNGNGKGKGAAASGAPETKGEAKSSLKTAGDAAPVKRPSRVNAANVMGSKLLLVDEIHAENGMVCMTRKDGGREVMRPEEAVHRAREINMLHMETADERRKWELIERTIEAARTALYHLEDSKGAQYRPARELRNMAEGRAPDGRDVLTCGKEDMHVRFYVENCPHLKDWEIAAVLRSREIDGQQAHTLIMGMEKVRAAERNGLPGVA